MHVERHIVPILTDAAEDGLGYTPVVTGRVLGIRYVKTDFANGVDFTITVEGTGETLWAENDVNASKSVYPRAQVHSSAGVALTLEGAEPACEPVALARDRVKIAVATGGVAKVGTFHVLIG